MTTISECRDCGEATIGQVCHDCGEAVRLAKTFTYGRRTRTSRVNGYHQKQEGTDNARRA